MRTSRLAMKRRSPENFDENRIIDCGSWQGGESAYSAHDCGTRRTAWLRHTLGARTRRIVRSLYRVEVSVLAGRSFCRAEHNRMDGPVRRAHLDRRADEQDSPRDRHLPGAGT